METQFLLERLNALAGKEGNVDMKAEELRRVLSHVKGLETALADTLRFMYGNRRRKASSRI